MKKFSVEIITMGGDTYERECFANTQEEAAKQFRCKTEDVLSCHEIKQIFWFSRNEMSKEMLQALYRVYGFCDVCHISKKVNSAHDFKADIDSASVIAIDSLSLDLQNQFLELAGNKQVIAPVYQNNRFLKWEWLIKLEMIKVDLYRG